MHKWVLADNNFTFLDRLKIAGFFLNQKNRWTQDRFVREYEKLAANYVGAKYAVFVSSGSAANQLICQKIKDDIIKKGEWPRRNKVIVSAVTWQTNVSVWVREGFEPIFLDVDLNDFCIDYFKLLGIIANRADEIACIFPTSVLGYVPKRMGEMIKLAHEYNLNLKFDNCENFFGEFGGLNINSLTTSSTSCFIAHHITTGSEGGFIFTNNYDEYEYYLLSRAHGLLRNLNQYNILPIYNTDTKPNTLVDKNFDFQTLSSNYRSTDIQAFMGILDFNRADEYKKHRIKLYNLFKDNLDLEMYYLPPEKKWVDDCAFCLPIICEYGYLVDSVKKYLDDKEIERRGFISGNMLRQLPYQKYGKHEDFINAEYLNSNAMYIGLHQKVTEKMVLDLTTNLNNLI